jgi:thioesterase domain-containing protein/acyl carrier protein
VIASSETSSEPVLTAYFLSANGSEPEAEELRAHLKASLPEFMVPSSFVRLQQFPLTSNGKIDHQALSSRQFSTVYSGVPSGDTDIEYKLVNIFKRVLGLKHVSASASFFDLGGDSLTAMRLVSEIARDFGKNLPLSTIFQAPTIEQLAASLRQFTGSSTTLIPVRTKGVLPPIFFVHSPVATQQALADLLGPEQPFYGLQQRGLDGRENPATSIVDMATDYLSEVRKVQPSGPYYLAGACLGGVVAFEMAQQLRAKKEPVPLLLLLDSFFPEERMDVFNPSAKFYWLRRMDRKLGEMLLSWETGANQHSIRFRKMLGHFTSVRRRAAMLSAVDEANLKSVAKYVPRPYSGRIVMFLASMAAHRACYDARLGWADVAVNGLEVQLIPGNHTNMMESSNLPALAAKLKTCLAKSRELNHPVLSETAEQKYS